MTGPLLPPLWIEDAPAPAPAKYGLFSVAMGPLPLPDQGIASGTEYLSDDCGTPRIYPGLCDLTPATKTFDPMGSTVKGLPYVAYQGLVCGSQTFDFATMERKVRARLASKEQTEAEMMLWGTTAGDDVSYFFAGAPATNITVNNLGASASIVVGLGVLEQQLASCYAGHPGIIHMRPKLAAFLSDRYGAVRWDGTAWRTQRGNFVVFGDGYSGIGPGPDNPTATTEWMFATGRVVVWRSDQTDVPDPRQTFDRAANQYKLLAERQYVVAVECCIAATKVTIP